MASEESGERRLQQEMDSSVRADRFYERQMLQSLNTTMIDLIQRQELFFVATADAAGNCDCSPRFGKPGFISVIDVTTLAYPEFRGNGVFASLGNILDNPHVGLVFLDLFDTTVGLHVNGTAYSYRTSELPQSFAEYLVENDSANTRVVERWVVITVEEAYIHCSKHVPRLEKIQKPIDWGTDDPVAKSSDYFVKDLDRTDREVGSRLENEIG